MSNHILQVREQRSTILLRDLISSRQIRIEVMFPIKRRASLNITSQGDGRTYGQVNTFTIQLRQSSGKSSIEGDNVGVWSIKERRGGGRVRKELLTGFYLCVSLDADNNLPARPARVRRVCPERMEEAVRRRRGRTAAQTCRCKLDQHQLQRTRVFVEVTPVGTSLHFSTLGRSQPVCHHGHSANVESEQLSSSKLQV